MPRPSTVWAAIISRDAYRSNAVLAAAGYNFSLLLPWLAGLLRVLFHALFTAVPDANQPKNRRLTVLHNRLRRYRLRLGDLAAFAEQFVEIGDRALETRLQRGARLPIEHAFRLRDVGTALDRIVDRQCLVGDFRARSRQIDDHLRQLGDRGLDRIAEIHRPDHRVGRVHHPQEALDQIVDIAEGARLRAIALQRDRLVLERLHDEIGDDPPVIGVHARTVGVEDPHHADADLVLAVIIEEQGFGAAFALIITGARPDRIDVAPVA